jgi:RNA polymerase sigma-70 factor (ECF subfamily)
MSSQDRESRFAEQLCRHHRRLFGYIYTLLRNFDDAEDVFQQTSLTLWEKFDEYQAGTNFAAWACAIAHFKSHNFLTQHRRYQSHFSEAFQLRLAAIQAAIPVKELDMRTAALEDCVEKLPARQRELVRRCFGGAQTVRELARGLGRTTHSLYSSLRNIRKKLLDCVDQVVVERGEK